MRRRRDTPCADPRLRILNNRDQELDRERRRQDERMQISEAQAQLSAGNADQRKSAMERLREERGF